MFVVATWLTITDRRFDWQILVDWLTDIDIALGMDLTCVIVNRMFRCSRDIIWSIDWLIVNWSEKQTLSREAEKMTPWQEDKNGDNYLQGVPMKTIP